MRALSHSRLLLFLIPSLISGCVMPAEETDESAEFDEQIGQTQQAATQAQKNWWKGLWQTDRNFKILVRAYQDYNASSPKYVGKNCKQWVQQVVLDASKTVVVVPTTSPNAYGWKWNSSSYVQDLGQSINNVWPGDIVQMNYKQDSGYITPHTAIVYLKSGGTIWWIDSNWNQNQPDNKVRIRKQSIADWIKHVTIGGVQKYTVYRITGG